MISYFRKSNFVFFGTPEFAAIILKKLIEGGFPPAVVICNPDRPTGRKKIITPPPTKVVAERHGIRVLQPEKLEVEDLKLEIGEIDLAVVAAYAKIIPQKILGIPHLGTIGVHPSLLPKYRGPSPIQTAILNGDEETGVTIYLLDEKVDRGQIVSSVKCQVSSNETHETLLKKLAELGGSLLVEVLPKFLNGEIKPQPQNESGATYTKKFTAEDGFVAPEDLGAAASGPNSETALVIERKIRALNPEPGVWTIQNGKRTKILEAEITDGKLNLKKIQVEGRKPRFV